MGIRRLLDRFLLMSRCWIPGARRQGDWFFLPARWLDGRRNVVYRHDEPIYDGDRVLLVAEHLHRSAARGGAVENFVRGRVAQRGRPPLDLDGWHLALQRRD